MWLIGGLSIFVSVATLAFYLRLDSSSWTGFFGRVNGERYRWRQTGGNIRELVFELAVDCESPYRFECHRERRRDRLFKWLGLSIEIQTGNAGFDRRIYIVCDSLNFKSWLTEQPAAQQAVLDVFTEGAKCVVCDGGVLSAMFPALKASELSERNGLLAVAPLHALARKLTAELPKHEGASRDDRVWKAILILSLSTALAATAGTEIFRAMYVQVSTVLLSQDDLIVMGLLAGSALFLVLLVLNLWWLGRSSRFHLVLLETIALGLPGALVCGIFWVGDVNTALDSRPAVAIHVEVDRVWKESRGRRGRSPPDYYFSIQPGSELPRSRTKFRISSAIFEQLRLVNKVTLHVKPGALGAPWIEQFVVADPVKLTR